MHQACFYHSPAQLAGAVAPIVEAGPRRGDAVFAAAKPASLAALGDLFNGVEARTELRISEDWCPRPWERMAEMRQMLGSLSEGATLYAFGEPLWWGSNAAVREWARCESIINLAFAGAPMVFVCLYDERELPDEILAHGRRTHPERLANGSPCPCEEFVPPAELVPALVAPPGETPVGVRELGLDGGQHSFRIALTRAAEDDGLPPERIEQLVVAANEVATNALVHGRAPRRARCWTAEGEFVCEIADSGPGFTDPLAGWLLPKWPSEGGWGLAISRQLCDAVEIAPDGEGTRVTLHVGFGSDLRARRAA